MDVVGQIAPVTPGVREERKRRVPSMAQLMKRATPERREDYEKLGVLAVEAMAAMIAAVGRYYELCCFIRSKQISPDEATAILKAKGLPDSRVSEVKRVAYSSDDIFKKFESKVIGFKQAVKQIRQLESGDHLSELEKKQLRLSKSLIEAVNESGKEQTWELRGWVVTVKRKKP